MLGSWGGWSSLLPHYVSLGASPPVTYPGGLSSSRTARLPPWRLRATPSKRVKQNPRVLLKTRLGTGTLLPPPVSPGPGGKRGVLAAVFGDQTSNNPFEAIAINSPTLQMENN